ncbi:NUDIX domain-containing protein [Paenibacillus turpanensis]|uniref:NUDIX domain-containing protein n=1 Tax=Paenibacillus turpanensis TaxID=2689078 RepID=UPI00140A6952|nr:NUDIX domain-containing protein [Paenibacillus turpanensis]
MRPIRNSAKAVIIQDNRLLLTVNQGQQGQYYLFPGGGQEPGETLREAVVRECMEEIGQEVEPGELLCVREYIGKNHQFAQWDSEIHQVEFYFVCRLKADPSEVELRNGAVPDPAQIGVEWVELERLNEIELYPKTLGTSFQRGKAGSVYIGDVN